ncbi:MAG: competence protein ComFB [Oleispira sp.]|jgi:competence protein ComFB
MAIINHISNYYEQVVSEEVRRQLFSRADALGMGFMADVTCVALNRLPPKYYRYEVDMAFYMSPDDLFEAQERVTKVVTQAITFVEHHSRVD